MATSFSQENLVDSSCLSSQRELDYNRMSFATLHIGLTKIESLTNRLGYLSSFVSAIEETLEFSSSFSLIFRYCSNEIVGLAETARKTLESAGVVPYLWASCPERLTPHKRVYVQLLRLLHSNERDIAPQLRKRLRALLMPLTSQFSITKNSDWRQRVATRTPFYGGMNARVPMYRTIHNPELHEAGRDRCMPPPPPPPFFQTPVFRRRSNGGKTLTRSIKRRLWAEEELFPSLNPSSHKHREKVRSWADSDNNDEENSVSEENFIPFRQPRATLRFGICFNRKSSSQQSGGRLSNMNYKE